MNSRKALIIVNSYFPTGVAISSRMLNFCRLLRDAGWKVHVITGHHVDSKVEVGKIYCVEGITYQVASLKKPSGLYTFIGNAELTKVIKEYLSKNKVDIVFMNAAIEDFRVIKNLCNRNLCNLFVEQCEWLDLSNYRFGKFDYRYLNTQLLRQNGFKGATGVVSISRLLNDYYSSINVPTIRIPTILDVKNSQFAYKTKKNDKRIHIVFAGSLGGSKELLKPIFEAFAYNAEYRKRIVFDIYGPTVDQIIKNIDGDDNLLNKVSDCVSINGRIKQEKIPEVYSMSDYLIFIRPQRRSSNAGFPTKFAESMSVGTPVITNDTGDIGLYLRSGVNGFLLENNTSDSVCRCFESLINTDDSDYSKMRENARETAEKNFDYRNYIDSVSSFFILNEGVKNA